MHYILSKRYQQPQPEECSTIALLLQQRYTITQFAQRLKRSVGTISQKLKRNAQDGCYASQVTITSTRQRSRSGRPAKKLHAEGILFGVMHHFFNLRWLPEQIALILVSIDPKGHELRLSTVTMYKCIYAQPVGQLKKDLIQALRRARNTRIPISKGQDRHWQIPGMLSIQLRPSQIEEGLLPGHWEGDLIKVPANASTLGTLVERTSRVVMLEMALLKELCHNTGIAVYFCDPNSPWQRGPNENMNGLVRQYLPKRTNLSFYSQAQLEAIADQINNRPRKGLGVRSPMAAYTELLLNSQQDSMLIH